MNSATRHPKIPRGLIIVGLCLLLLPQLTGSGLAADDEFRVNSLNGTATWKLLIAGLTVPINQDAGTLSQETHRWYAGDVECQCTHRNWVGACDSWDGNGDWIVVFFNEVFRGTTPVGLTTRNSDMWSSDGAGVTWHVSAHSSDTLFGKTKCEADFAGSKASQGSISGLAASGFHDVANARTHTTYSRVALGVPFTQLSVAVPFSEICSEGVVQWRGSLAHAEFHFEGPARTCTGGVAVGTLIGDGSSAG